MTPVFVDTWFQTTKQPRSFSRSREHPWHYSLCNGVGVTSRSTSLRAPSVSRPSSDDSREHTRSVAESENGGNGHATIKTGHVQIAALDG